MTTEPEPTVEVKTVETPPATLRAALTGDEPKAAPAKAAAKPSAEPKAKPKATAKEKADAESAAKPKAEPKPKKQPAEWANDVQLYGKRDPEGHTPGRDCACGPKLVALPEGDGERIEVRHR